MKCCNRVCALVAIVAVSSVLDSLSGTYTIAVSEAISKQYQLSPTQTKWLSETQRVAYLASTIILTYGASQGNRVKWMSIALIGGAVGHLIAGTPNFLFHDQPTLFNMSDLEEIIAVPPELLEDGVKPELLLDVGPIKKLMPEFVRETLLDKYYNREDDDYDYDGGFFGIYYGGDSKEKNDTLRSKRSERLKRALGDQLPDEIPFDLNRILLPVQLLMGKPPKPPKRPDFAKKGQELIMSVVFGDGDVKEVFKFIQDRLREGVPEPLKAGMLRAASAPLGFCQSHVNQLKVKVATARCHREQYNLAAFAILLVAMALIGIGHSLAWTLGIPLLDDLASPLIAPAYIALLAVMKLLSPVLGFLAGAACNRLHDELVSPIKNMPPIDPRWVGAWWLGFFVVGGFLLILGVVMICFLAADSSSIRASIKGAQGYELKPLRSDGHYPHHDPDTKPADENPIAHAIQGFFSSLWRLASCSLFAYATLGRAFDVFALKGLITYLPHFIDVQYGIVPFKANFIVAGCGVLGMLFGIPIGAFLLSGLRLNGRAAASLVLVCNLLAIACAVVPTFVLICSPTTAAITKMDISTNFNRTTSCNADCFCDPVGAMPVCAEDGTAFYSPCHASCTNMTMIAPGKFKFQKCECVSAELKNKEVKREWCVDDCRPMMIGYIVLSVFGALCTGVALVPQILLVIRAVAPRNRSLALAVSAVLCTFVMYASLPVFDSILNSSCLQWQTGCENVQTCSKYDVTQLPIRLTVLTGVLRLCACLCDAAVLYLAKGLMLVGLSSGDNDSDEVSPGDYWMNGRALELDATN